MVAPLIMIGDEGQDAGEIVALCADFHEALIKFGNWRRRMASRRGVPEVRSAVRVAFRCADRRRATRHRGVATRHRAGCRRCNIIGELLVEEANSSVS